MTEENELSLLITKFNSLGRKKRDEILSMLLDGVDPDKFTDFCNYKPTVDENKNITSGDIIKVGINFSSYPSLDINWYQQNNLVDDENNIKVKVSQINPFTGTYLIYAKWSGIAIQCNRKVSAYNIPKQDDLFEL